MKKNSLCIYIVIIVALFSCGKNQEAVTVEETTESDSTASRVTVTEAQYRNAEIQIGKIEQRQISGTVKANGVLDVPPQQLVSVSAPLAGFLKNTELLQGSHIKKGQVVATIENLDFIQLQQDYLDSKSHFEFAKADYERQQQLAREEVNSAKTIQQSKSNYLSWQAKYMGLREKLNVVKLDIPSIEAGKFTSLITIYSPIDGYVTQVNVNIGKFVNPTDVLFEIVDTEHLHAELTVFEKDVPKIKIGQKVRFTLANGTKELSAKVYLIGRQISADRTVRIHCHIDKEDKELLPGMYLTAQIETGDNLVSALPESAIIPFQGKKFVFIPTTNSKDFDMVEVQTGDSESGFTSIINGPITAETNVVVKGGYALLAMLKNTEGE
jgi:cobalt-zinc-cadmium efflux system membrane fusion protein